MFFARRFCGEHISCRSFFSGGQCGHWNSGNLPKPCRTGRTRQNDNKSQHNPRRNLSASLLTPAGFSLILNRMCGQNLLLRQNHTNRQKPPAGGLASRLGMLPLFCMAGCGPSPAGDSIKNRKDGITGLGCYTVLADACTFGRRLCGLWDVRFWSGLIGLGKGVWVISACRGRCSCRRGRIPPRGT